MIGADELATFVTWREPEEFSTDAVAVAPPGFPRDEQEEVLEQLDRRTGRLFEIEPHPAVPPSPWRASPWRADRRLSCRRPWHGRSSERGLYSPGPAARL